MLGVGEKRRADDPEQAGLQRAVLEEGAGRAAGDDEELRGHDLRSAKSRPAPMFPQGSSFHVH